MTVDHHTRTHNRGHAAPRDWASTQDASTAARAVLDRPVWEFLNAHAGRGQTARGNRRAWDSMSLVPNPLVPATNPDTSTSLVGTPAAIPAVVAPIAYQRLVHESGELAVAEAARDAGVPYVIPTLGSHPVEEITTLGGPCWFQLYPLRDTGLERELVHRAQDAGCSALVVTVDAPTMRRKLSGPAAGVRLPSEAISAHVPTISGGGDVAAQTETALNGTADWAWLERLCHRSDLAVIVKGLLTVESAQRAAACGAAGMVVSNHGGRLLDGCVPTATALAEIIDAVAGACTVLVDGGIRTGIDILRALRLGASGVLVGRPVLWGLAHGTPGVARVLELLHDELATAMTLTGCATVGVAGDLGIRTH